MALLDQYVGPWTNAEASHLLRRAGFGGSQADRSLMIFLGLTGAVDSLVDFSPNDPHLDQPGTAGTGTIGSPFADLPNDESDLGQTKLGRSARDLQAHFLYRMRYTAQPFQEQWGLFLHDHFVSEYFKVRKGVRFAANFGNDGSLPNQECMTGSLPPDEFRERKITYNLLRTQNYLFRTTAIDSFRQTLIDMTRDPAMLLYLDNYLNLAGRPQENYARELMELFSMGVDNFSEADVQEISKCLTGEGLPFSACEDDYQYDVWGFDPALHEPGSKFVFGQSIAESMSGQETVDVIDLIMDKVSVEPNVTGLAPPYNTLPATAVYMSWKIVRWFVNEDIELTPVPDDIVLELADYMRGSDGAPYPQRRFPYDMKAVVRKLLTSEYFYDSANRYSMVKNPIDFIVTALRGLVLWEEFARFDGPSETTVNAGMSMFEAPNVAGWDHGNAWLTSGYMVARFNYGRRLDQRILNATVFPVRTPAYLASYLSVNGGPLSSYDDNNTLVDHLYDAVVHQPATTEERTQLLDFLNNFPQVAPTPEANFRNKLGGFIHLLLTLPKFQLK